MVNAVASIAAVGALLAALFSGLGLFTTTKLEHRRWIRDALVDSFVELLVLDFRGAKLARSIAEARTLEPHEPGDKEFRLKELMEVHDEALNIITRLRLLVGAETFEAAFHLHGVTDRWLELAQDSDSADLMTRISDLQLASIQARQAIVVQARRELRLAGPGSNPWVLPTGEEFRA